MLIHSVSGWMDLWNSLCYSCNSSVSLKSFQNKKLSKINLWWKFRIMVILGWVYPGGLLKCLIWVITWVYTHIKCHWVEYLRFNHFTVCKLHFNQKKSKKTRIASFLSLSEESGQASEPTREKWLRRGSKGPVEVQSLAGQLWPAGEATCARKVVSRTVVQWVGFIQENWASQ